MEPNARDCHHGRLRRACYECDQETEIAELKAQIADLKELLRELRQGLDEYWTTQSQALLARVAAALKENTDGPKAEGTI